MQHPHLMDEQTPALGPATLAVGALAPQSRRGLGRLRTIPNAAGSTEKWDDAL
jgi:hypothetical protein